MQVSNRKYLLGNRDVVQYKNDMAIQNDKVLNHMDGPYIFSLLPHILISKL